MSEDAVLDTLLLPLATGAIPRPETADSLFLRARASAACRHIFGDRLVCEQSFKPFADALVHAGFRMSDPGDETAPLVLMLPPRQREEARALMAHAISRATPGGTVVAAMSNNEGARSGEQDMKLLGGNVNSLSKNKCRVFWTRVDEQTRQNPLIEAWSAIDAPRAIADGRFRSRPGLFAWDRVDQASALLAACLPGDLAGRAADLGAGYGYLSVELLARNPGIFALDVYEAEARALAMARLNLANAGPRVETGFHWHDVTVGLPGRYDVIVSNPPFHQGRADEPDLGKAFIVAAAQALNPGGRLWLVANRHLPYEAVLAAHFASVRTVVAQHGFKVIEARKAIA